MRVWDPIYGSFSVSAELERLLVTPEVRRLSQVRLLNTVTPSLATLGELRRYSHTLGVLHLSDLAALDGFPAEERRAFKAAVLLHDIGTPAFGHLFEYHLRDATGWTHEAIIRDVLWGFHARENRSHQLFGGHPIEFRRALEHLAIDRTIVERIVLGDHPLSALLFGTLDLDNIDNVVRMAWALGLSHRNGLAGDLAAALGVTKQHGLTLSHTAAALFEEWRALRNSVYRVLVFDPPTVAAQAVLSYAISHALADGHLTADDWTLSDEGLLHRLRAHPDLKEMVNLQFLGRLPYPVFICQLQGTLQALGLGTRTDVERAITFVLDGAFPGRFVVPYVFVDRGSFDKRCVFEDVASGTAWNGGETSESVVLYAFARTGQRPSQKLCGWVLNAVLERLHISRERIQYATTRAEDLHDYQSAIAFAH